MTDASAEAAINAVLARLDAAWRERRADGLDECFAETAVIVGPGYVTYAAGREACAASYREFAANAAVLDYAETGALLRVWPDTAVRTVAWRMSYQREAGPRHESGTEQLVLSRFGDAWRVVFRHLQFEPAE